MSPSAEQLIRDYLNQVSVAARTRLHSEDRRAFLARMRFAIERRCGTPGTADPVEVAEVLASLGDPQKLVETECARLQAAGGEAAGTGDTGRPGPRLGRPQGSPQRRRGSGTRSLRLVSGTGLGSSSAPGAKPTIGNRPLTGEIRIQSRPITSRWRPGEPLQPRPPKQPKQPKQARRFRIAKGGKGGQNAAADDSAGQGSVPAREPGVGPGKASLSPSVGPGAAAGRTSAADLGLGTAAGPRSGDSRRPETGHGLNGLPEAGQRRPGAAPSSGPNSQPGAAPASGPNSQAGAASASWKLRRPGDEPALGAGARPGERPGSGGASVLDGEIAAGRASVPGGGAGVPGGAGMPGGDSARGAASGHQRQQRSGDLAGSEEDSGSDIDWFPGMGPRVTKTGPADGLEPQLPGMGSQLAAMVARFASSMTEMWRGSPLEGTVVALLLVAGLVYPFPIWLLGFLLWTAGILTALASKFWDTKDKWTGLAVPVVVAVVGTGVALARGGAHDTARAYAHEIGAVGPPLLRAAIVLGAVYLAWRVRRGPRSSAVPPWNRPHRI